MSDIKLKNGSGTEVTYTGVTNIKVPSTTSGSTVTFTETSDATVTSAAQIRSGYTAYANGTKYTGSLATYSGSTSVTPGTSSTTLYTSGKYCSSNITVAGDSDLIASNIKSGTVIFGVTGTYSGSQSANTTSLSSYSQEYESMSGTYTQKYTFDSITDIDKVVFAFGQYSSSSVLFNYLNSSWTGYTSEWSSSSTYSSSPYVSGTEFRFPGTAPSGSYGLANLSTFNTSSATAAVTITTSGSSKASKSDSYYVLNFSSSDVRMFGSTTTSDNPIIMASSSDTYYSSPKTATCTSMDSSASSAYGMNFKIGFADKISEAASGMSGGGYYYQRAAYEAGQSSTIETYTQPTVGTAYAMYGDSPYICFAFSSGIMADVTLDGSSIMSSSGPESDYTYYNVQCSSNISYTVTYDTSMNSYTVTCTTSN